MGLRRSARRHQAGTDTTIWWDFVPGEEVVTVEGLTGVVTAVEDGPFAGAEQYIVELHDGLGGGVYSPGELTKAGVAKTATTHDGEDMWSIASDDYPELSEILVERPPLPHSEKVATKQAVNSSVAYQEWDRLVGQYSQLSQWSFSVGTIGDSRAGGITNFSYKTVTIAPWLASSSNIDQIIDTVRHEAAHVIAGASAGHGRVWKAIARQLGISNPSASSLMEGVDPGYKWLSICWTTDCPDFGPHLSGGWFRKPSSVYICRECRQPLEIVPAEDAKGLASVASFCGTFSDVERIAQKLPPLDAGLHEGGFWDRVLAPAAEWMISNQPEGERYNPATGEMPSYDACAHRRNRMCQLPKDFDPVGAIMGENVWSDEIRGFCWREKWRDQKACPLYTPGPNSFGPTPRHGQSTPAQSVEDLSDPPDGGEQSLVRDIGEMVNEFRRSKNPYSGDSSSNPYSATIREAAWADVRDKANRIRGGGGVRILSATPNHVAGQVQGDTNIYESVIEFVPGTRQLAQWTCGCPWFAYSFGRSGRWVKYEGRQCSHSLALLYEYQSRGMFGQEVTEDVEAPEWLDDPSITVQRPGDYKKPDYGEWRVAALARPIVVKWRGLIEKVVDILHGGSTLLLSNGEEVSPAEVVHPDYHPTLGLTAAKTAYAQPEDKRVTLTFNREWDRYIVRDAVTGTQVAWVVKIKYGDNPGEWHGYIPGNLTSMTQLSASQISQINLHVVVDSTLKSAVEEIVWKLERKYSYRFGEADQFYGSKNAAVENRKTAENVDIEDGVMIAIRPPDSVLRPIYVPEGEAFDQLHVTLAYLGKDHEVDRDDLVEAVKEWASSVGDLSGRIQGYGVFENDEKVLWASVNLPGLSEARVALVDTLSDYSIFVASNHDFLPHLTLQYGATAVPDSLPTEAQEEFVIGEVWVVHGPNWIPVSLAGQAPQPSLHEAELRDEPEPALPETTAEDDAAEFALEEPASDDEDVPEPGSEKLSWIMGGKNGTAQSDSDSEIAQAAEAHLAKLGLKNFTPDEQAEIINEGQDVVASNLDRLDITGTHYEAIEAMESDDEDYEDLWAAMT